MRMVEGLRRIIKGSILSAGLTQVFGGREKNSHHLDTQMRRRFRGARLHYIGLYKPEMNLEPIPAGNTELILLIYQTGI